MGSWLIRPPGGPGRPREEGAGVEGTTTPKGFDGDPPSRACGAESCEGDGCEERGCGEDGCDGDGCATSGDGRDAAGCAALGCDDGCGAPGEGEVIGDAGPDESGDAEPAP
jgi:hypothetical protein